MTSERLGTSGAEEFVRPRRSRPGSGGPSISPLAVTGSEAQS